MERLIRVTAPEKKIKAVRQLCDENDAQLLSISASYEGSKTAGILITRDDPQQFFDKLYDVLGDGDDWRIVVQSVEAVMPYEEDGEHDAGEGNVAESREELYDKIADGARYGWPTASLTAASAIVAAVGLVQDNVTVLIGAMVISPLLDPILAMILGTALGEFRLMFHSLRNAAFGLAIGVGIGVLTGLVLEVDPQGSQIAWRTDVGLGNIVLALASGAAAALSLTVGLSEALVGVMVAVALLPPAVAAGLLFGNGALFLASGSVLLFLVNVAAITLAAQIVFLIQDVRPRSSYAKKAATRSVAVSLIVWTLILGILVGADYFRGWYVG